MLPSTITERNSSESVALDLKAVYQEYKSLFATYRTAIRQYKISMRSMPGPSSTRTLALMNYYDRTKEPEYPFTHYINNLITLINQEETVIDSDALKYIFSENILDENQTISHRFVFNLDENLTRRSLSIFEHIMLDELQHENPFFTSASQANYLLESLLRKVSATNIVLSSLMHDTCLYEYEERTYFHPISILDETYSAPFRKESSLDTLFHAFFNELIILARSNDTDKKKSYLESFIKSGDVHFISLLIIFNAEKNRAFLAKSFEQAFNLLLQEEYANDVERLATQNPQLFEYVLPEQDLENATSPVASCREKCMAQLALVVDIKNSIKNIIPCKKSMLNFFATEKKNEYTEKLGRCITLQDLQKCLKDFPYRNQENALKDVLLSFLPVSRQDYPIDEIVNMVSPVVFFPSDSEKRQGGRFTAVTSFMPDFTEEAEEGISLMQVSLKGG
jgi:hypothetical protein